VNYLGKNYGNSYFNLAIATFNDHPMPTNDIQNCLIIFARYPEPGQVKTRLIPALGAEGAARVYREMAEHTLNQAKKAAQTKGIALQLWFTGGDRETLRQWLGPDLTYSPQPEGDLGDRLTFAFQSAFQAKYQTAIAIGTDCPSLDTAFLLQAFKALDNHDVVLGPATDGGYYLIGLQRPRPELFLNIAWSTADVLRQTEAVADGLGLTRYHLPSLTDVDNPEDLELWRQIKETVNR
jgi:rSAM/selenodomain-associated transferase 1